MRREVLRLEHIRKSLDGDSLLSDINLAVYHSTFHCLLIPNQRSRMCLVNILRGKLTADSGTLYVNDKAVKATELRKHGVACVFKNSSLISHISIAENIFLTDDSYYWRGLTRLRLMSSLASQLLNETGIQNITALHQAGMLKTYDAHKVEMISAISKGAQILCLDNVAEQYTDSEMSDFWQFINYLIQTGITVIMITPKYNFFCDHAHFTTIVDKGSTVITLPAPLNSREQLLKHFHITESHITNMQSVMSQRVLCFNGQTQQRKEIDISVHCGEIAGVYDEDRSITNSIIDVLTGLDRQCKVTINERPAVIDSIQSSIKKGIVLIHDGSASNQIFTNMSLAQNITVNMCAPLYNRFGLRSTAVERYITRHTLKTLHCDYLYDRYSKYKRLPVLPWHEQMKIVVARWLCRKPQVFVFINPLLNYNDVTVQEFYSLLSILKEHGYGVLIISSSLTELRRITGS